MYKKFSVFAIVAILIILVVTQVAAATGINKAPARQAQITVTGAEVMFPRAMDSFGPLRDIPPHEPRWKDLIEVPRKMLPNRPGTPEAPIDDPALQQEPGAPSGSVGVSFEGVNNVNGVLPPDTNGAIGPNHYVQIVNLSFAIYDRSGNKLYGPANVNTLFSGLGGACETRNDGDPIVLYDSIADRWLISQFALPSYPRGPFYQCLAISQTGDPLGSYYRYSFQWSTSKLNDYPKFGVWPDGYYISVNQFSMPFGTWGGQGVGVFERDKMLLGQTARLIKFDLYNTDPNLGGMLPSDFDGSAPALGTPNYFAEIDDNAWGYSPDQIQIWEFHTDWANPSASTFSRTHQLGVTAFDSNMCGGSRTCIPQPGGTALDAIADRLMYRLQFRDFGSYKTLVTNHTVDVNGADRAGVRWYELRNSGGGWSIYQQGTYSPDSNHRWMGSAAMNGAGQIGLGFSISSLSVSPSVYFTGRLPSDAPGTMGAEGSIVTGTGWQDHSASRWGDYSMLDVDPRDDCTFWFTSEYMTSTTPGNAAWRTRVGSFTLGTCDGIPTPTPTTPPSPTPTSQPGYVHIGDLDGSKTIRSLYWNAMVTITAHDQNHAALSGVLVSGNWDIGGTSSCTTDVTGKCSVAKTRISLSTPSVRFSVTNASKSGYTYNSAANHDPDGDSNGTAITIIK